MNKFISKILTSISIIAISIFVFNLEVHAQDSVISVPKKIVKNTFEGNFIIDNQTVMVAQKNTLEFDLQHRFGVITNSFHDFFGFFNISNMRFGFSYTPVKNLLVGIGLTGDRMQTDLDIKYALIKQTRDGSTPISITYSGNVAMDCRGKYDSTANYNSTGQRLSYFNQILIARKFNDKLSLQIAPSWSHFNSIVDPSGNMDLGTKDDHFAIAISGRYKISPKTAIIANYDLPINKTSGVVPNPLPNLSFGFDFNTSGHDFQLFMGNYAYTLPQSNNYYNQNDLTKGQFVIGFNMTRLWNF